MMEMQYPNQQIPAHWFSQPFLVHLYHIGNIGSTCFLCPSVQQPTTFLTKKEIEIGSEFTLKSKITIYAEYEAIWASHKRE